MIRVNIILLILSLSLVFLPSCATLEYLDGSTEEEKAVFQMSKEEMYDELKTQKAKNKNLKKELDALKTQKKLQPKPEDRHVIEKTREENRYLVQEMDKLREELRSVSTENEQLEKKLAEVQVKEEAPPPVLQKVKRDLGRLKIKVLSGDGDMNSARRMAKRLEDIGYSVQMVDRAPRATFRSAVIFYASHVVDEARRLHGDLDFIPVLKPLTWSSRFDIILVTVSSR